MLFRYLVLSLLLTLPFTPVWAKNDSLLLVADTWSPMTDAALKEGGFSLHLTKTMLKELGYQVKVKFQKWKRIERDMGSSKYDVISAIWHTPERAKLLAFSKPYDTNRLVFISRQEAKFLYSGPQSLNGKTLGLTSSYAYPDEVLNAKGVNIKFVSENRQNLLKLDRGRIDLALGDYLVMKYQAGLSLPGTPLYYDLKHPLAEIPLYMAVSRAHPEHEKIVSGMNRLLNQYRQDGTYLRLQKEHGLD